MEQSEHIAPYANPTLFSRLAPWEISLRRPDCAWERTKDHCLPTLPLPIASRIRSLIRSTSGTCTDTLFASSRFQVVFVHLSPTLRTRPKIRLGVRDFPTGVHNVYCCTEPPRKVTYAWESTISRFSIPSQKFIQQPPYVRCVTRSAIPCALQSYAFPFKIIGRSARGVLDI
jgi:hypothetical protein